MADLLKWEKATPIDFYATKSHMWILLDGKVKVTAKKKDQIHAQIWGSDAWNIASRGYYNDNYALVQCHGKVAPELERKLAKKFPRAIYITDAQ